MSNKKKIYHPPRIIPIGDLTESTLGASGTVSDSGGFQANGNGKQQSNRSRSTTQKSGTFDRSAFDRSIFDR